MPNALSAFKLLADENIATAVIDQLASQGVEIRRVTHILPEGAPDPVVLAYALEDEHALLTHDEQITDQITTRYRKGIGHAGVFLAAGTGTVQDDAVNHVKYI
ncbi:MAG: DUF5615 family PIN-like protein [Chloroflexi bacterium]|nr:DUF5615 family PIN-like protein [Chloroflexota bacterium]